MTAMFRPKDGPVKAGAIRTSRRIPPMSGQPDQRAERIGVYGGTFDPVHVGHVVVATECRHALDLDRVLLVVAGDPWQKRGKVVADSAARLLLARAAVEGIAGVDASDVEI